MRAISQAMKRESFDSPEEAQVFLNSLIGREMEEIIEDFGDPEEEMVFVELDLVCAAENAEEFARRARIISRRYPESLDAQIVHARAAGSAAAAAKRYRKVIALGEKLLGTLIAEAEGHLWGHHEARPYLDAMFELAEMQEMAGREEEAARLYREILRLNEVDNQGARFALMRVLLKANRNTEARELYLDYEDEVTCSWIYARALLEFRRILERHPWKVTEADLERALRRIEPPEVPEVFSKADPYLERALDANPVMARYLLVPRSAPSEEPAAYRLGSEEEARTCFLDQVEAWSSQTASYLWLSSGTLRWMFAYKRGDLLADLPPLPKG